MDSLPLHLQKKAGAIHNQKQMENELSLYASNELIKEEKERGKELSTSTFKKKNILRTFKNEKS
jgi:hypothetical protein